ncbi:B-block binding subunit of TFIIIC, partial [Trema orientale]
MDSVISSALEEICSHGEAGVSLPKLCSSLNPSLSASNLDPSSPGFKQALWAGLLGVPALQFRAPHNATYGASDPAVQSFEAAESLDLKLVADERLRDSFLGLYNVHSSNAKLPSNQRRTLQRLALARENGITQNQLGKEFGIKGQYLFYVLRKLEYQGLIVRQSAVVKTKEACDEGEARNSQSVTTNLVYLSRYAKHLGSQQQFEITMEEQTTESLGDVKGDDDLAGRGDVLVKDYLPAMKAVCDKLEKANGKVLVVSDIKKELGYIGATAWHREWRKICSRLIDAHIVEEFHAKVNDKVERCLRLLKIFSPESLELKTLGSIDDDFEEEQVKLGKKCQVSNQLVELPIEHQVYDMIDAAGSKGLTMVEVCRGLGIDNKKNYDRLVSMFSRFGMDLQKENHNKGEVHRVWTPGRRNPESANAYPSKTNTVNNNRTFDDFGNLDAHNRSAAACSESDPSVLTKDIASPEKMESTDLSRGPPQDTDSNLLGNNSQEILIESKDTFSETGLDLVSMEMETNVNPSETSIVLKPSNSESNRRYPCLPLTVENARREKWILERLQNEKFIIIPELRKWLRSLEKDKCTTTDSKTIDRLLNKLQQEGHCKCLKINVPVLKNYGGSRTTQVVLHPDVQSLSPELVSEIHDRLRSFEIQSRGQCSSRLKNNESIPVLNDVQRTQNHASSDARAIKSEAMRANGFILAKIIRAKLLHSFLWDHLYGSGNSNEDLSSGKRVYELHNPYSSSKLFSLEATIKAIPIELFLQVVGSTQNFDNMIEKCKQGLCLSDLPVQEYKSLMDDHGTKRLSSVIDILRRLKLIRMVSDEHPKDGSQVLQATFIHALELKPYIEEPISKDSISLSFRPLDLRPRIRHDFVLSNRKAVDEYWTTLEYCYAAADPRAALHAFPGSTVNEVSMEEILIPPFFCK